MLFFQMDLSWQFEKGELFALRKTGVSSIEDTRVGADTQVRPYGDGIGKSGPQFLFRLGN
jgi:hypothetical protein